MGRRRCFDGCHWHLANVGRPHWRDASGRRRLISGASGHSACGTGLVKTPLWIVVLCLVASPWALEAAEPPVVFARSGQSVMLPVPGDHGLAGRPLALWAYGRFWTEPGTAEGGTVRLVAPKVRVPVVFRLVPVGDQKAVLGELVVYPDRLVPWEKKTRLAAADAPDWFETWSKAVGLPVEELQGPGSLDSGHWRPAEKPALLIVGRKAAGDGPAAVCRLAARCQANVLVLEADWFGKAAAADRAFVVAAKQMAGPLADWQGQRWALPPAFRWRVLPWPGVLNRQAWIAGGEYPSPLAEEIIMFGPSKRTESFRTVLSYLPWQEQLGRREMADELFLRLLTETAAGAKARPPLDGRWCLLYPDVKEVRAGPRPVLAAALSSAVAGPGEEAPAPAAAPGRQLRGCVLDLRGKTPPPDDLWQRAGGLTTIEARIGAKTPLLILGDHPLLDRWKWLQLDRRQHRSPRPGVVWWPDSSLPPSLECQLRLMQLFTEWRISLGDISQETSHENRKNEL